MKSRISTYRAICLCSIPFALLASPVQAQTAAPQESATDDSGVGDIVVTASRREESLQSVGISVTAIGGENLVKLGVKQMTDVVAQVPGFKYRAYSPSSTVFNVRGVSQNAFDAHIEPPIAFYVDDAYMAAATNIAGAPSFDMGRVEVLRGPQGTLFGRNATGGLVHFISARPTKEFEGYVDLMAGTRDHYSAEAAVSGPISDQVQFRLSGVYNYRAPYMKNDAGTDAGGQNNYAFRGQIAMQPTETLNLLFIGRYAKNDNEKFSGGLGKPSYPDADRLGRLIGPDENPWGTCNGCDKLGYKDADGNPLTISNDQAGRFNRTIYGFQGRAEWDLTDEVQLTSITDYLHLKKLKYGDEDGTPLPVLDDTYRQKYYQISQETRLSGNMDNFRWTMGFYYLNWKSDEGTTVVMKRVYGTEANPFVSAFTGLYRTTTVSVFGQAEYDFTPKLTFIGGIRWVNDKKTVDYRLTDTFGSNVIFNPDTYPLLARKNWSDWAARAQINYKATDDILLYASFNRGIKGPNWVAPLFAPINPNLLGHGGETLLAYEAGIKSSWLNNKVRLNLSGFYYDYQDYQAFNFLNNVSSMRNLPARSYGAEAELTVAPFKGFTISSGISLLNTKVKDVVLQSGRVVAPDMPMAPGYSGNLLATYEAPVSDSLKASIQYDMTFTDDFSYTLYPGQSTHQPGYAVGNVRLSLSDIDDRWNVALFSRNVWNKKYSVYSIDLSGTNGETVYFYGEPRWFGIQLRYNLGR
ncbi:MAG: TonB-dependent receptor [Sphingobium sp.]